jgi:hypothetical protein
VRAERSRVFAAITADPSTWTWFPGARGGSYDGDKRSITVGRFTYNETVLVRDEGARWVYHVDETNAPYAHALVEEWLFTDHPDGTLVRWTFCVDPMLVLRLPGARLYLALTFKRAMRNLQARLA